MTKTIHPADAAQLALIPQARQFIASLFLGQGKYDKRAAETLAEARARAAEISAGHKWPNGRKAMIYAVLADGREVLVPDAYEPAAAAPITRPETEDDTMKTTHTSNGFTIAQLNAANGVKKKAAKPAASKPAKVTSAKEKASTKKAKATSAAAKKTLAPKKAPKLGKRAALEADARAGKLPAPPDFTAATHERFRPKLAEVVKLAKAGDLKGLKAIEIKPVSTSPKAIARYRDLCVLALEAKKAA